MTPSSSIRLIDRVAKSVGREAANRWWHLAEVTHRQALGGDPWPVVPTLDKRAAEEPQSPLAPAYHLWAGDALARVAQDRDALTRYDRVISAADGAPAFERIDFPNEALRQRAPILTRLGDIDGAIASYRELEARGEKGSLYLAGVTAELAGRFDGAESIYRETAASERGPDAHDPAQRALRGAERLANKTGTFTSSAKDIARLVEDALHSRDAVALRRLASPTHLQAGPGGGHFRFETDDVLEHLCADLHRSRPTRIHPGLLGTGDKRYLLTTGWRGEWFEHIVGFYFARSGRGWEWQGLVVNAPAHPWMERWTTKEPRTNQALTLPLLAPWPEGRYFMAGGLSVFLLQAAELAALAWIPFIGAGLAAARALTFSLTRCGVGLRGFYYNVGPTHEGDDAFAIDFTSYQRGVPLLNISGGTRVLSPADGIVRWARGHVPSGADWQTNEVQIDHDDPVTGNPRYVTRYLHLAGPGKVLVSTAMPAPTGRRLGYMNDTGTSVIDHLHFSIHDTTLGPGIGPSVRPSPMDGQTLGDGDTGKCLRSTNRETIVLPPGCGAIVVELFRRLFGGR